MLSSASHCAEYLATTNWNRAAGVLFIVALGGGLGIGFSVAADRARQISNDESKALSDTFIEWQMKITSQFTRAESLAATFAAYLKSSAVVATNFSKPLQERYEIINNASFFQLVDEMVASVPGIMSIQLHPHGVISQQWPQGFTQDAFDMMTHVSRGIRYADVVSGGKPITVGPYLFSQGGVGVVIRYPVYVDYVKNNQTFYGMANILMRFTEIFKALGVESVTKQGFDYVCYYVTKDGTQSTMTSSHGANEKEVIERGLRMTLPVSEPGTHTYFAMYPRAGLTSDQISPPVVGAIIAGVLGAALLLVALMYTALFAAFLYRHRYAPRPSGGRGCKGNTTVHLSVIALRGAQSVVENAPQEATRMFAEFGAAVRAVSKLYRCYVVCDVGDRCVYVASSSATDAMAMAQDLVSSVSIAPRIPPASPTTRRNRAQSDALSPTTGVTMVSPHELRSSSHSRRSSLSSASATQVTSRHLSRLEDSAIPPSASSNALVSSVPCHPSAACHTATTQRVYDPARDVYFYGSLSVASRLGAVADATIAGEVAWTDALHESSAATQSYSHTVMEKERVSIYVSTLWQSEVEGDDHSAEDPSMAVTMMTDAYVRSMAALVGEAGHMPGGGRRVGKGRGKASVASSDHSNNATLLTRSATILHITVTGDAKGAIDVCKRVVAEERGAVVSAHETVIVAAYNLLSAGGHHQLRAADTVQRLRSALPPTTRFVCSLHHGKVQALVSEGLVMCTGEVVSVGRLLLERAVEMAKLGDALSPSVSKLVSGNIVAGKTNLFSSPNALQQLAAPGLGHNGLCLLLCASEVTSAYDCEALDVVLAPQPRVMSRLVGPKVSAGADAHADDEWMYQLKENEDKSPYAIINSIFSKIAQNSMDEAGAMWQQLIAADTNGSGALSEAAKEGVAKFL